MISPACRSQLGSAVRSQLGVLSCEGGDILIWQHENGPVVPLSSYRYTDAVSIYEEMGIPVHSNLEWTGNIRDYRLVYVSFTVAGSAVTDPSWWPTIEGGSWSGRIHLEGERNGTLIPTNTWISSQSALTGMTLVPSVGTVDFGCNHQGTVVADDMTAGLTTFRYAGCGMVTGGTVLSRTKAGGTRPGTPWIARNKVGGIDWIVSAESNHFDDACNVVLTHNRPFVENLWNVDI